MSERTVTFQSAEDKGSWVKVQFTTSKGIWTMATRNRAILSVNPGTTLKVDAEKGEKGWAFQNFSGGESAKSSGGSSSDTASLAGILKSCIEAGLVKEGDDLFFWAKCAREALEGKAPVKEAPSFADPFDDDIPM